MNCEVGHKAMVFNLVQYCVILLYPVHICAQVILVDDMNLGRAPDGRRSLSNISRNLQQYYGDDVRVLKPQRRVPAVQRSNVISQFKVKIPSRVSPEQNVPQAQFRNRRPSGMRQTIPSLPVVPARPVSNVQIQPISNAQPVPNVQPVSNVQPQPVTRPLLTQQKVPQRKRGAIYSPMYFPDTSMPEESTDDILKDLQSPALDDSTQQPAPEPAKSRSRLRPRSTTRERKPASTYTPSKTVEIEPYSLETSTPEIDKALDENIFDERPETKTQESTAVPTTTTETRTVTRTVKEPVKVIETVSVTVPEKKESEEDGDDIKKTAAEISKVVVPRMKSKEYLMRHNTDILSADKARRTYIDYKILESKENQLNIEKKLRSLREIQDKLLAKLDRLKNERDEVRSKTEMVKSNLENNDTTVQSLQEEIEKGNGQIKLEEMEIAKLEKALSEEKNKYVILSEQQKIFKGRLSSLGRKGGSSHDEVKLNEKKLSDYEKLVKQIEEDVENLTTKIEEVEEKRRVEIENQNRLEIEKKDIEDSNHLPLFALYD